MSAISVNVDNFTRAESDRMFAGIAQQAGGVGKWNHLRTPTPVDQQTIIRMNRDTLYSMAVLDLTGGATLTVPDGAGRYVTVMVIDQDHYVSRTFSEPGTYELTTAEFGTEYVALLARVLIDPEDAEDVAIVNALQDALVIDGGTARPFEMPDYDVASLDATRSALLELGKWLGGSERMFGKRGEVDPTRHLIGTAMGWGGLPVEQAVYVNVTPELPVGEYTLTVQEVPVDGFWSISLYNGAGYFQDNPQGVYSVNSVVAKSNEDGSVTVRFGGGAGEANTLPIMEGWNYVVRLYRPRAEILDGSWKFPSIEA
ncbi:DUF1214 domain-containing protein [Demequina aurantiaca]|uniref:DUF1214 domain-containing protein n=1 Tax=Demequina aurantiaca TaxID=676200 RepID=UPI003D34FBF8